MTTKRVGVIDAGLGNLGSVISAFERQTCVVDRLLVPPSSTSLSDISHVVLPGVGAYSKGMEALQKSGWADWLISQWVPQERPLLGICLGMQLLSSFGTEGCSDTSKTSGLGLIPGQVNLLPRCDNIILPHVGWNELHWSYPDHSLASGLPQNGDMYFVHSYAFATDNVEHTLALSDYGQKFSAVVGSGNCLGVQFHPEKSQKLGSRLISNFLDLA